ncbi:MAG: hypothetical protein PVH17_12470 [Anaerolineae bacterium]|jgi:hypothetical protein
MTRDKLGTAWAGLGLIGLGIAFLVANVVGWEKIWPIFPVLGGLAFFGGYVSTGLRDGGLAFVGTAATLVGLFFFGFTFGLWEWEQMEQLWPVFPFIGGVAFCVLFLADRRSRDVGVLGVGCAALIIGVVGLGFTYRLVTGDIVKLWPLLIIFVGLISLVGGLFQWSRSRRE